MIFDKETSFGIGTIGLFLEHTDLNFSQLFDALKNNPFKYIPILIYCSILYPKRRNEEVIDFSLYDVMDWVDKIGGINAKEVQTFLEDFTKSMVKDVPESKETKKKMKA